MKKLILMMSVLLSAGWFCACSNDLGDGIMVDPDGNIITSYYASEVQSFNPGDVNKLRITSSLGYTDTCWLINPYCGIIEAPMTICESNGNHYEYPMVFTVDVKNSRLFDIMQFDIHSMSPTKIENLRVGDTFVDNFGPGDIYLKAWGGMLYDEVPSAVDGIIPWEHTKGGTLSGIIQVVDKKTSNDGKTRITLSLQDLQFYDYDKDLKNQINIKLNGLIEFEVCEDGIYPNPPEPFDMKSALIPSGELMFFMTEALYGDKFQGRRTFFSENNGEQECLIINSEEEFRKVYKGDKTLPDPIINFEYCSLVIGRTYGENGSVTLGDFDFADNGDTYQLNLTLNDNVNINYAYSPDEADLYFWRIYPKMENKPVVFNRIIKESNIDPLDKESVSSMIRKRWVLDFYAEVDSISNTWQYYADGINKGCTIEFMENGRLEGHVNENTYSCNYMIPYTTKLDDSIFEHGIMNLRDLEVAKASDDNPASKRFMRIFNATQFDLDTYRGDILILFVSPHEYYSFLREDLVRYD